jgi:RNA polymerase sigma-70 factor (ECF subfamily)
MAESDDEFRDLMDRVLAGSNDAARELTERYGRHLRHAVRLRLSKDLRPKFDSLDFVQDIWAAFFAGLPRSRPFASPTELVTFLTAVARNKVVDATRQRLLSEKYDVTRELPLEEVLTEDEEVLAARQPTASEVAMGREEWERLLRTQPAAYRRILLLLHDGKPPAAVARELAINERTVRRVAGKVAPWLIG